jgi:hypothetical protein
MSCSIFIPCNANPGIDLSVRSSCAPRTALSTTMFTPRSTIQNYTSWRVATANISNTQLSAASLPHTSPWTTRDLSCLVTRIWINFAKPNSAATSHTRTVTDRLNRLLPRSSHHSRRETLLQAEDPFPFLPPPMRHAPVGEADYQCCPKTETFLFTVTTRTLILAIVLARHPPKPLHSKARKWAGHPLLGPKRMVLLEWPSDKSYPPTMPLPYLRPNVRQLYHTLPAYAPSMSTIGGDLNLRPPTPLHSPQKQKTKQDQQRNSYSAMTSDEIKPFMPMARHSFVLTLIMPPLIGYGTSIFLIQTSRWQHDSSNIR